MSPYINKAFSPPSPDSPPASSDSNSSSFSSGSKSLSTEPGSSDSGGASLSGESGRSRDSEPEAANATFPQGAPPKEGSAAWFRLHRKDPLYAAAAGSQHPPPSMLEAVHALLKFKSSDRMTRDAFER
jgi:hypothetical protein